MNVQTESAQGQALSHRTAATPPDSPRYTRLMNDRDFWATVFLQALQDSSVEEAADHADASLAKIRERFGPVHFTVRQPTTDPMVDRVIHAANHHARAHSVDEPDRLKADFSSGVRANERNVDRDRTNEPGAQ